MSPTVVLPRTILELQIQPLNLSLLGLNFHIGVDSSPTNTAPIKIDVVAIPTSTPYVSPIDGLTYQGGLLGDLFNGGGIFLGPFVDDLLPALQADFNSINAGLSAFLNTLVSQTGGPYGLGSPGSITVVDVPLGTVSVDLLGLLVQTTTIDVNITAIRSNGPLGLLLSPYPWVMVY